MLYQMVLFTDSSTNNSACYIFRSEQNLKRIHKVLCFFCFFTSVPK